MFAVAASIGLFAFFSFESRLQADKKVITHGRGFDSYQVAIRNPDSARTIWRKEFSDYPSFSWNEEHSALAISHGWSVTIWRANLTRKVRLEPLPNGFGEPPSLDFAWSPSSRFVLLRIAPTQGDMILGTACLFLVDTQRAHSWRLSDNCTYAKWHKNGEIEFGSLHSLGESMEPYAAVNRQRIWPAIGQPRFDHLEMHEYPG